MSQLLESDGFNIELMQGTKDGGVDIIATKLHGISGYYKTLWQAKKYSKNKVSINTVRELADSVNEFKASKGIIVTSTYLTKDALYRIERDKYILSKVDRVDLDNWINSILRRHL
ncbi:restriction endonuclease [Niastella yeongjuensis]|nr:restriction endonuclease [Niastella yeongjuensis]